MPQLAVRRGRDAIEFYKAAFGAVEEYRVGGTDDNEAVVAQLSVEGAPFWVADDSPAHANHSPESLGGATTRMVLIVDDPEAMLRRAVSAGAIEDALCFCVRYVFCEKTKRAHTASLVFAPGLRAR